jgi:hypothetical protein
MSAPDAPIYNPNVPQNPDRNLAETQPEFLANFQSLFDQFAANHVPLNETNVGNHTNVQMLPQPKDLQTGASELNIYTKQVEGQTTEVFLRYAGNGDPIQLTAYQIYRVPTVATQVSYFTFLPGNLLIYFGSFTTLPGNKLILTPPICTKVVSVSFCQKTSATLFPKPFVEIIQPEEGFVEGMFVQSAQLFPGIPPERAATKPSYYIVVGNI